MTKKPPKGSRYECCAHCVHADGRQLCDGFHDTPCEYAWCQAGKQVKP